MQSKMHFAFQIVLYYLYFYSNAKENLNIALFSSESMNKSVFYRGNRMKSIGIKLADGTFYPLLEEGNPEKKTIDLTTVMDNQTKVQVGVYRTETGSLEGAEYIDTLEITNLNPHQNGEPTLCLAIDVDENNELSAEIRDTETGRSSEFQVTLVSRTLSEASSAAQAAEDDDSVTISDNDLENAGLEDFVTSVAENADEDEFPFDDVNKTITQEMPEADEAIFGEDSLELPELKTEDETEPDVIPEEDFSADTVSEPETESVPEDADAADADSEETDKAAKESPEPQEDVQDDFDLPNFDSFEDEPSAKEQQAPEETVSEDAAFTDGFSLPDETEETRADELPSVTEENDAEETGENSFMDDLPDFDDTEFDDGTNSFELPDFDDEKAESSLLPDDDDFSLPPDFDESPEPQKDPTFQPNTSMFSNLYDKETMQGASSSYSEEDDDIRKKTKGPVIICVICAIICIIAALLVLFVIPSRLNIFAKAEKAQALEETEADIFPEKNQESESAEIGKLPELPAPVEAQEDVIVVAETPESVIPEPPAPPPQPPADIRYKIVWGDTLWDISNAYYKTPWKYKRIASYNGIRNPDHIISGTWILIPAE